jgi:hypothetical protein
MRETAVCLATRRAAQHRKIDRQKRRYVWLSICSMVFNLKRDFALDPRIEELALFKFKAAVAAGSFYF